MRYRGQSFEVETPLQLSLAGNAGRCRHQRAFHQEHERVYEHADHTARRYRLSTCVWSSRPRAQPAFAEVEALAEPAPFTTGRGMCHTRAGPGGGDLRPCKTDVWGHFFMGPAIVSGRTAQPGCLITRWCGVDGFGNLRITPAVVTADARQEAS